MTKNFIANLLVNQARQTMIDSIDNTDDIGFLKCELKKQLRENWDRQEDKENFIKYLEDNIKHYKQFLNSERMNMTQDECKRCITRWVTYQEILERIKNRNYE